MTNTVKQNKIGPKHSTYILCRGWKENLATGPNFHLRPVKFSFRNFFKCISVHFFCSVILRDRRLMRGARIELLLWKCSTWWGARSLALHCTIFVLRHCITFMIMWLRTSYRDWCSTGRTDIIRTAFCFWLCTKMCPLLSWYSMRHYSARCSKKYCSRHSQVYM